MPNEIYHRSEWGNPKAEGFGDVYFDASATNKLYNHSDNYENSDGTDKILRDIPNKASIVLTPTAYSDGSLNTVIPPYQVLPEELVTNGTFDTDSDWTKGANWNISGGTANADGTSLGALLQLVSLAEIGKKYLLKFSISNYTSGNIRVYYGGVFTDFVTANGDYTQTITAISTDGNFQTSMSSAFNGSIDNVSVKEIQEADFDFSRGSSATRVNEKGLIEDVQILSGNLVQNGDFEQIGSEEITNGTFDTDLSGWQTDGVNATNTITWEPNGVRFVCVDANIGFSQFNALTAGKTYKLTCDVTVTTGSLGLDGSILVGGSTINLVNGFNEIYFVANLTTLKIKRTSTVSDCLLDNVSVKEVGQNWTFGTGWSMGDGKVVGNSVSLNFLTQLFSFVSGKKYRLTCTITGTDTLNNNNSFRLPYDGDVSNIAYATKDVDGVYTHEFVSNGSNTLYIGYIDSGTFTGSIDNVSVIEITDDTDIPRIDYTGGQGAFLLEPQSTNKVTYSEDFSQWNLGTDTTVEFGYLAPDGSNNAYKVSGTVGTSSIFLGGVLGTDTRTIWARSVSGTGTANLCSYGGNTNNNFTITEQWQRFEVNGTTTSVGASNFYAVDFRFNEDNPLSEIIVWGAQAEALSYATSYIPTEGSTVTRSADVANNSGNADLINSTEGVLYAEIAALADDGTNREITLSDGTIDNYVLIRFNSGGSNRIYTRVDVNTSIQYFELNTSYNITNYNKIAIRFKNSDFATFINGTKVDFQLSGNSFPSNTLNKLNFDNGGGYNKFHGNVKSVAVFKEALTDAELESLTSWVSFVEMATDLEYTLE